MMKPKGMTVCLRGFEVALYAKVKAQAKAEGMLVRDWLRAEGRNRDNRRELLYRGIEANLGCFELR